MSDPLNRAHGLPVGPLIEVNDPDDPRLDLYRDLNDPASRSRLEGDHPALVVEGRLAVDRLLTSPYTVRSLLLDDHQLASAGDLVNATRAGGAPVFVASRAVLASTVGFSLHRGVVAIANRPPPTDPSRLLVDVAGRPDSKRSPRLLGVLEGLNDHENIGALFRNAAAFGVAGILLDPTCADPLYRRSIRVSVGHILHLPFARLVPWPSGLRQVRAAGFVVAGLVPRPATTNSVPSVGLAELKTLLSSPERPTGVALLLGAEGPGLTEATLAACDLLVSIPMTERVDSLNVATAAAVAFHALGGL